MFSDPVQRMVTPRCREQSRVELALSWKRDDGSIPRRVSQSEGERGHGE